MKKKLITLFFAVSATFSYAQLRLDSITGHVSIGNVYPDNEAQLNVKWDASNQIVDDIQGMRMDVKVNNCYHASGVMVTTQGTSVSFNSGPWLTGVLSYAGFGQSGYVSAISGCLRATQNGAGIYGSSYGLAGVGMNDMYAGFFDGKVKVTGTINSTSLVHPSDESLAENIQTLSYNRDPSVSALRNLLAMNVVSYDLKDRRLLLPDSPVLKFVEEGDSVREVVTSSHEEAKKMANKPMKRHYGIMGQELQKIYPDLVEKDGDGFLEVNYVELVPILIQSIQELKQELDAVKGGSEYKTRSINDEIADFNAVTTGNVLYQNTPNPFKEQTSIRFKLADDATNAVICIFDMSGKMLKKLPVSSGMTSISVNGYELGEGMYLYTLIVNGCEMDTKRMILTN